MRASATIGSPSPGLPGSGKNTWLARHAPDLEVVSLDDLRRRLGIDPTDDQGRVVQLAKERCRELLCSGTSFALNASNTMRQTRRRWIDLFADYDARIKVVYVEPTFYHLLRQNKAREHAVPEQVIQRLAERCEPPNWTECHQLVMVDDHAL